MITNSYFLLVTEDFKFRVEHFDWLISKLDGVTKWKDFGVHLKVSYRECSKIEDKYWKCNDCLRLGG